MDRNDLTLAVAAALVLAVLLGWLLAWIVGRLNARGPGSVSRTRDLAERLQAAEAGRRAAESRLAAVEADLGARLAEAEGDLAAALADVERERAQTEDLRAAYRAAMQDRAT